MKEALKKEVNGSTLTLTVLGEIDHHSAKGLREAIDAELFYHRPRTLYLVLSEVSFMDSSGLAVVINALRNMTKIEGQLALSGLNQQPMKVFRTSGIDKLVNIKEEVK